MSEINAKKIIEEWKEELKVVLSGLKSQPKLVVIVAKDYNPASKTYVNNKRRVGVELGIIVEVIEMEWQGKTKQELFKELSLAVTESNNDKSVNGIIVQDPFPLVSQLEVSEMINPDKDVDGFTREQKGMLDDGDKKALVPATALGVLRALKHEFNGDLTGKYCAIVNRSGLIGKPLHKLLLHENAVPVVLHTKVPRFLKEGIIKSADIVITGCGKRKIFNEEDFGDETTVIDCSMYKEEGIPGVGDVDKERVLEKNPTIKIMGGYGATGSLTCVAVTSNTIQAYMQQNNIS